MPPASATPALTLEDLQLELWVTIVNVFLPGLSSVVALSRVSRACRAAAHTLRHTLKAELRSEECLRTLVETGAWPRLTILYMHVGGGKRGAATNLGTLLPLMAARGMGLFTSQDELEVYLEHHAATYPIPYLWVWDTVCVPEGPITHLTASLTRLSFPGCDALQALPESIGQLGVLKDLNLSKCYVLASLPESIGQLGALTTLDLGGCRGLTALSEGIGQLGALTCLDVSHCTTLKALPESIGQLASLTDLSLRSCRLVSQIPQSIGQLSSLTALKLPDCRALALAQRPRPPRLVGLPGSARVA